MTNSRSALAFDVYGTLIDTAGVVAALTAVVGERAGEFSRLWREKQLEYSFRHALMRRYVDFSVCVSEALDYTAACLAVSLSAEDRDTLLGAFGNLPPFADASRCLDRFDDDAFDLYALSNGSASAVEKLLTGAGIANRFSGIVSVEEVSTFKPDERVYRHFLSRAKVSGSHAWLISGNPFDVIGAVSAGMRAVWVRRGADAVFDPWGIEPTITVTGLAGLRDEISARC